ncbi:MAG: hypothetical protein J7497_15935, partial [Chitinophagaceae bacterium]|nr:hypothetical protein [Chitinophagaceae bacterium]
RDGRYCGYLIDGPQKYTIIQATDSDWKHKLAGERIGFFSGDNRYYIYQTGDSLCFLPLVDGVYTVMKNVATYNLRDDDNRNEWLAIELKDKTVLLQNLLNGKEKRFTNVGNYSFERGNNWFSCQLNNATRKLATVELSTGETRNYEHIIGHRFYQNGQVLILQTEQEDAQSLLWVNPLNGKISLVWTANAQDSSNISSYAVDKVGQRLVFIMQTGSAMNKSIWYYKKGMDKAVQKALNDPTGKIAGLELTGTPLFSDDGRYIIISMRESVMDKRKPQADAVQVNVWNYRDTFLMSAQVSADGTNGELNEWLKEETYTFSMPAEGEGVASNLSGAHERLFVAGGKEYAAINKRLITDRFWEDWATPEIYIVSLRDGKRISLRKGISSQFSPDGTWMLCYDSKSGQYLRYDIDTKKYTNLSGAGIYFGEENEFYGTGRQPQLRRGIAGWLEGGKSLLVYDHYDIWQLDVTGKKPPINLTNGRRNKIRFEIIRKDWEVGSSTFYGSLDRLMLTAVNM